MNQHLPNVGEQVVIKKPALETVLETLITEGYDVVGPTLREGAIVYDAIDGISDLPVGLTDVQSPGSYRVRERADEYLFGYVVGPTSWKQYLYPPEIELFSTNNGSNGFEILTNNDSVPKYALIGVRACDLAAIAIQDRIFIDAAIQDPHYRARRSEAFILAVNCTEPAGTCFCVSMNTGPQCSGDFDLAVTELRDCLLIEIGSPVGAHMMAESGWRLAGAMEINRAKTSLGEAEKKMGRTLDTSDLPDMLLERLDYPRWEKTAQRCLSCTNCTMVCPTCFCTDVKDISDLTGDNTKRIRVWDSCFNPDFSYVHGGNARPGICSRYRQWLTHKLASWHGQFGVSGCVGCGRCITWCPVGIDLTEEVTALREEV